MAVGGKIIVHHVGGRDGRRGFPIVPRFESDLVSVLYDADKTCLADIREKNKMHASRLLVFPYCLGRRAGKRAFNINADPLASSLRVLNPDKKNWYFHFRKTGRDIVFGEAMRTVSRPQVSVVTLDSLCARPHPRVPSPDFLSLDTQGTELDVLQGGERALRRALAVVSEVSFHEVYKGQKLFGDVSRFLAQRGFSFVKFTKYILDCSPYRYPVGLRGEGFQTVTDALYLRDIASLRRIAPAAARALMLEKLAFFAVVYCQLEYALECLREAERAAPLPSARVYQKFLRELRQLAFPTNPAAPGPRVEALCRSYGLAEQASVFERIRKEHRV